MTDKTYHMGRDNWDDLTFYCPEDRKSSCSTTRMTLELIKTPTERWLRAHVIGEDWFTDHLKKHVLPMEFFD